MYLLLLWSQRSVADERQNQKNVQVISIFSNNLYSRIRLRDSSPPSCSHLSSIRHLAACLRSAGLDGIYFGFQNNLSQLSLSSGSRRLGSTRGGSKLSRLVGFRQLQLSSAEAEAEAGAKPKLFLITRQSFHFFFTKSWHPSYLAKQQADFYPVYLRECCFSILEQARVHFELWAGSCLVHSYFCVFPSHNWNPGAFVWHSSSSSFIFNNLRVHLFYVRFINFIFSACLK